jgi:hypothetical protein
VCPAAPELPCQTMTHARVATAGLEGRTAWKRDYQSSMMLRTTTGVVPEKEILMEQILSIAGPNIGKKFIRFVLGVLGLLILRGILGLLPMLKNASAIGDSLLSPLVLSYAVVDTVILLVVLDFGIKLGADIQPNDQRLHDLGKIISRATVILVLTFAYKAYEVPTACLFVGRADLMSFGKNSTPANYGDFMRMWSQIVGQVSAAAIQNATGDALVGYQQLAVAVFRQPPNIYAWTFLILIAIPVVGLVPLVSRNLDTLTELVSHAATALHGAARTPGTVTVSSAPSAVERPFSERGQGMSPSSVVEKLTKLKSLLDSGAISKDDFEDQKKRILGRMPDSKSATEPEDLRKLKELLESGALTEGEYETHKKRFLEQI